MNRMGLDFSKEEDRSKARMHARCLMEDVAPYTAAEQQWLDDKWGGERGFLLALGLEDFDQHCRELGMISVRAMIPLEKEEAEREREAECGKDGEDGKGGEDEWGLGNWA